MIVLKIHQQFPCPSVLKIVDTLFSIKCFAKIGPLYPTEICIFLNFFFNLLIPFEIRVLCLNLIIALGILFVNGFNLTPRPAAIINACSMVLFFVIFHTKFEYLGYIKI